MTLVWPKGRRSRLSSTGYRASIWSAHGYNTKRGPWHPPLEVCMGRNLRALDDRVVVSIEPDDRGFIGRECPNEDCLGYFKIAPGTGDPSVTTCTCPYCGTNGENDQFCTSAQIAYAKSVALNRITGAFLKDLKALERRPTRGAFLSLGIEVRGRAHPVAHYRELVLETEVVCETCAVRYAIYGVFGYCPDCRRHNSFQMLDASLSVVARMLDLAADAEPDLAEKLIENALEDCVSAFDGWGRATAAAFAQQATEPQKAVALSFQNFAGARDRVRALFAFNFATALAEDDLYKLHVVFQKRHLLAHKMGVIDEHYIAATGETGTAGRKVAIAPDEVRASAVMLRVLASHFLNHVQQS